MAAALAAEVRRWDPVDLCTGSAFELEHWLELAPASGLTCPHEARREAQEISKMLNGLARRWSQGLMPEA